MKKYFPYIAGEFVETQAAISVINSYTRECFAEVSMASADDLERAIIAALKVEKELAVMPSYKRYEILMQIATRLKEEKDDIGITLSKEACKPLKLALAEVDRAIQTFIVAAEESKRLPAEYISVDWTAAGRPGEIFSCRFGSGDFAFQLSIEPGCA